MMWHVRVWRPDWTSPVEMTVGDEANTRAWIDGVMIGAMRYSSESPITITLTPIPAPSGDPFGLEEN